MSPRRTSPGHTGLTRRVLEYIGSALEPPTVDDIARAVLPRPRILFRDIAERRSANEVRRAHNRHARAQVARAINRLVSRGLVATVSHTRLSPHAFAAWQAGTWDGFCQPVPRVRQGNIVGWDESPPSAADEMRRAIVAALGGAGPTGLAPGVLAEAVGGLTAGGKPTGAYGRALASLVDDGDVYPARGRLLTAEGRKALEQAA